MKAKARPNFPEVTAKEVTEKVVKSATLNMRLTTADKAEMAKTAEAFGLTLTEYVWRCHAAVSKHAPKG